MTADSEMLAKTVSSVFLAVPLALLLSCSSQVDRELVSAAAAGKTDEVRSLVARGANPNAYANDAWTPLTVAAREGHLDTVRVLVELGAEIDQPEGGGTPLFWAVFRDRPAIAEFLISRGADPHRKAEGGGRSPLEEAKNRNRWEFLELLCKLGKLQAGCEERFRSSENYSVSLVRESAGKYFAVMNADEIRALIKNAKQVKIGDSRQSVIARLGHPTSDEASHRKETGEPLGRTVKYYARMCEKDLVNEYCDRVVHYFFGVNDRLEAVHSNVDGVRKQMWMDGVRK